MALTRMPGFCGNILYSFQRFKEQRALFGRENMEFVRCLCLLPSTVCICYRGICRDLLENSDIYTRYMRNALI